MVAARRWLCWVAAGGRGQCTWGRSPLGEGLEAEGRANTGVELTTSLLAYYGNNISVFGIRI